MECILVTPRSLTAARHPVIERLKAQGHDIVMPAPGKSPNEDELLALVPDVTGWLAGVEKVSPRVIEAARQLRAISRNGVGTDNLPVDILIERKIAVRIAAGSNAASVAELAIGLMFSALRQIPLCDTGIKQGQWPRRIGAEIRGRNVGVIGCGAIGAEVARLADALGCLVIAHDPMRPNINVGKGRLGWAQLPELLANSDIVTLHCPPARDGRALIGAGELAAMRPGAILINTARAQLIDEGAVIASLDAGHLGSYATDVFVDEPPRALSLAAHPKVIATSHIGGFTAQSVDRATEIAVANLMDALNSARPARPLPASR
jgi:D-3-phosphoglycerate dehydrogenase